MSDSHQEALREENRTTVSTARREERASGWRIAIVTTGDSYQQTKIQAAGLTDLVDAICISDHEGFRKPD